MTELHASLVVPQGLTADPAIVEEVRRFLDSFCTHELENGTQLLLLLDKRSKAYYVSCHLDSKTIAGKADLDAVLDPEESEDYKLNRGLYTDTYAYKLMKKDALQGRSFEDLVVEYDASYRPRKPLKVFGGQHRIEAIGEALAKGVSAVHGVRVYFCLSVEQKTNIAMANNTSIAVSNDLLDRMQEDLLGSDLRNWCQQIGLLDPGQNFADRRSPEGIPTVRTARTLIVNFLKGKEAPEGELHAPVICKSGPGVDENYTQVREHLDWSDPDLTTMGKEFSSIHKLQRERVLNRTKDKHIEFANKAIHPCVAASWSYAAGLFQRQPGSLKAHYALAGLGPSPADPLGAKALSTARLKGVDPDTYRGLGARMNSVELGRMLEVFVLQATKAKRPGISLKLANAAVKSYEARKATRDAENALGRI